MNGFELRSFLMKPIPYEAFFTDCSHDTVYLYSINIDIF